MLFLLLFRLLILVLGIIILYTQIIVPLSKRTKLWPAFRNKRTTLSEKITEVKEELEIQSIEEEFELLKAEAERAKKIGKRTLNDLETSIKDATKDVVQKVKQPRKPKVAKPGNINKPTQE